jgi:glycerol kinase
VGLGAPHWNPDARGALFGLTRATGPAELARAALEAICYQTCDLLAAMHNDWTGSAETVLRVDGGMVASDWTMQFLADMLDAAVDRPEVLETTALGAAWLAGMQAGVYPGPDGYAKLWRRNRRFEPSMNNNERADRLAQWRRAVAAVIAFAT